MVDELYVTSGTHSMRFVKGELEITKEMAFESGNRYSCLVDLRRDTVVVIGIYNLNVLPAGAYDGFTILMGYQTRIKLVLHSNCTIQDVKEYPKIDASAAYLNYEGDELLVIPSKSIAYRIKKRDYETPTTNTEKAITNSDIHQTIKQFMEQFKIFPKAPQGLSTWYAGQTEETCSIETISDSSIFLTIDRKRIYLHYDQSDTITFGKAVVYVNDKIAVSFLTEKKAFILIGKSNFYLNRKNDMCRKDKILLVRKLLSRIQQEYVNQPYNGDFEKYLDSTEMIYNADSTLPIQYAINRFITDPHAVCTTEEAFNKSKPQTTGVFGGIGIQIAKKGKLLEVMSSISGTPASRMGIQSGDQIVKIEGKSTNSMTVADVVEKIRGDTATTIAITIRKANMPNDIDYNIAREIIRVKSVPYVGVIDGNIGYVLLQSFSQDAASEVEKAVNDLINKNAKGLIIDLRNNPGGLLPQAIEVAGKFLPKKSLIVSTKSRNQEQNKEYNSVANPVYPKALPLAVLVNYGSASASEIVASALKDSDRGVIIGNTTFGKGSIQSILPLDATHHLKLTTALYYSPSGMCFEGNGITPDTLIPNGVIAPTIILMLRDQIFQQFAIFAKAKQKEQGKGLSSLILDEQATYNAFKSFLVSFGSQYSAEMIDQNEALTKEIYNALLCVEYGFGTPEYYRQYLLRDFQVLTAASILKDEKRYSSILRPYRKHH
jgi:carboxyl-terminal processing protease